MRHLVFFPQPDVREFFFNSFLFLPRQARVMKARSFGLAPGPGPPSFSGFLAAHAVPPFGGQQQVPFFFRAFQTASIVLSLSIPWSSSNPWFDLRPENAESNTHPHPGGVIAPFPFPCLTNHTLGISCPSGTFPPFFLFFISDRHLVRPV